MSKLFDESSLAMIPSAMKDGKLYSIKPVPVYGAELVTNGDFATDSDWSFSYGTSSSSWSISSGKLNVTNSVSYDRATQSGTLTAGTYKITVTISNYTSGQIVPILGNVLGVNFPSANGVHTSYMTIESSSYLLSIASNPTFTGSIDNVSVKEVLTASGDFDFSRGLNLAATRINSDGLIEKGRENLFTYSNEFSNAAWNLKTGVFAQGVSDPLGGNDAWSWTAQNTDPYLYQSIGTTGVYTLSALAKGVGSTIGKVFQIRNGSALQDFTLTSEWQRFELFNATGGTNIGFEVGNPAVSGDVVHIFQAQWEQGLVATDYITSGATTGKAGILENTPRFNYGDGASCPSLLLEPSATQLIEYTEYFGAWASVNVVLSANSAISPQGVQNAYQIDDDATSGEHKIEQSISSTTGVHSAFVKSNGGSYVQFVGVGTSWYQNFDITNGVLGTGDALSADIEDYGNGWYRIWAYDGNSNTKYQLNIVDSASASRARQYSGNGSNSIYIYGAQVEANSYATSYIPNHSGGTITRAADVCVGAGDVNTFNSTEGVLYAEMSASQIFRFGISNGISTPDRVLIGQGGDGSLFYLVTAGGVAQSTISLSGYNLNENYKIALKYKANDFALWVNGVEVSTDMSGSTPSVNTITSFDFIGQGQPFYGNVKQLLTFNTALSDQELSDLTNPYKTYQEFVTANAMTWESQSCTNNSITALKSLS